MYEKHGWWFPDQDTHFAAMLTKNIKKGGGPVYQEPVRTKSLQFVKQRDVALDIGANIGYTALHMAKFCGPSGTVFAVEPSPKNVHILRKNIELNGLDNRVKVFPIAISSGVGKRKLFIADETNLNSFKETIHSRTSIEVLTSSIDDFFEENNVLILNIILTL